MAYDARIENLPIAKIRLIGVTDDSLDLKRCSKIKFKLEVLLL